MGGERVASRKRKRSGEVRETESTPMGAGLIQIATELTASFT